MKNGMLLAGAALLAFAGSVGVASAQQQGSSSADRKGTNAAVVSAVSAAKTTGVSGFNSAMELAEIGRQQKDPLMLVAAARVVLAIGGTPGDDAGKSGAADTAKPAGGSGAATKPDATAKPLAERLLAEATGYARGNEVTLGLIRETQASAGRGTPAGPHRHDVRLGSRKYVDYTERFVQGQLAEAGVAGDGDTDVDITVYDANGNRICSSTRSGDREYCSWTPAWTGDFRIRVTNYGSVYNDVALLVN